MSIVLQGSTSGSITLQEPAIAGSTVLSLPATTGTVLTSVSPSSDLPSSINGPAFSAFAANDQSITNNVFTKVQINSETFDTNSCFDSTTNYRFTPNVAGYYQVNGAVKTTADNGSFSVIYKNGSILNYGSGGNSGLNIGGVFNGSVISQLVYLNGSTDYIELYVISGNNTSVKGSSTQTYFSASLVRGA